MTDCSGFERTDTVEGIAPIPRHKQKQETKYTTQYQPKQYFTTQAMRVLGLYGLYGVF